MYIYNNVYFYNLFAAERPTSTVSPPTIQQPKGKFSEMSFSLSSESVQLENNFYPNCTTKMCMDLKKL